MNRPAWAADGLYLAGPRNRFDFLLNIAGNLLKLNARHQLFAPERDGQHGNVINPLGLDDGWQRAQFARQPVLIGIQYVVEPHESLCTRYANLELHRQDGNAGTGDRVRVFNTRNLTEHLLGRTRDHVLDVLAAGAGESDQHVGHGDVDLWLFFARCDHHRKDPKQKRHQCKERCDRVILKRRGDAPGKAKRFGG